MSTTVAATHTPTVTVVAVEIPNHGRFAASAAALDLTISAFLPASPAQLRTAVEERVGFTEGEYADVTSPSALLVVLAATSGIDEDLFGRSFD